MARTSQASAHNEGLQKIAEDIAAVRTEREFNVGQLQHIEEGIDTILKHFANDKAAALTAASSSAMMQTLSRIDEGSSTAGNELIKLSNEIAEMRTEVAAIHGDIKGLRNIAAGGREDVRGDVQQLISHLARWFIGLMCLVIVCTVILFFHHG